MRLQVVNRGENGNVLTMGALIEVIAPTDFQYIVYYRAPVSGGGETVLFPGERLIVTGLPTAQLFKGGAELRATRSVFFELADPERESVIIDPVYGVLESAREEMRALYNGYSLYLTADDVG